MSGLHEDEILIDADTVRHLLREQRPDLADLPIAFAGGGTDNTMYRIGDGLIARIPRTTEKSDALRKELAWLPRLAPALGGSGIRIPEPVHAGEPGDVFPLPWAIYRWLDGEALDPAALDDARARMLGSDLADFVSRLRRLRVPEDAGEDLSSYRAGRLQDVADWARRVITRCRELPTGLDLDALERMWHEGLTAPPAPAVSVWLHTDLRPGNLLVTGGRLCAVIDFGGLSVGLPDAEHAPVWDLPPAARDAYWRAAETDRDTWLRARSWAILVALSGVAYYWDSYPAFVAECRARLAATLADSGDGIGG